VFFVLVAGLFAKIWYFVENMACEIVFFVIVETFFLLKGQFSVDFGAESCGKRAHRCNNPTL
jgi:hypothetical protein